MQLLNLLKSAQANAFSLNPDRQEPINLAAVKNAVCATIR